MYRYQMESCKEAELACPLLTAGKGEAVACMRDDCEWWYRNRDDDYSECIVHRLAHEVTTIAVKGKAGVQRAFNGR